VRLKRPLARPRALRWHVAQPSANSLAADLPWSRFWACAAPQVSAQIAPSAS